jgi:TolA-binding protein
VKANAEESFALVTNRIVELLLKLHPHETVRAAALLEELARRYPGTKHARAAAERAHRLAAN